MILNIKRLVAFVCFFICMIGICGEYPTVLSMVWGYGLVIFCGSILYQIFKGMNDREIEKFCLIPEGMLNED